MFRPFRADLFLELERRDWWWSVSPAAKVAYLELLRWAIESPASVRPTEPIPDVMWVSINPVAVGSKLLQRRLKLKATDEERKALAQEEFNAGRAAIDELVAEGAVKEFENEDWRFIFALVDAMPLVDALDTHRALSRQAYLQRKGGR